MHPTNTSSLWQNSTRNRKMTVSFHSSLFLSALSIASAFQTGGRHCFLGGKSLAARMQGSPRTPQSSLALFQDFGDGDGSFHFSESDRRRMKDLCDRYVTQLYEDFGNFSVFSLAHYHFLFSIMYRKVTMPILIIGTAILPDQSMEITRYVSIFIMKTGDNDLCYKYCTRVTID